MTSHETKTPTKKPKVDPLLEALKSESTATTKDSNVSHFVPRTSIGRLLQRDAQGLEAKVTELAQQRMLDEQNGNLILSIDPERIRSGELANRLALSLESTDQDFLELKDSLKEFGQILPAVVKKIEGGQFDYEIVSGHRRHAAILELNRETEGGFKIKAVLDTAANDPVTLALHMYIENANRKDLSAYEIGRMYKHWLTNGVFSSQGEIAKAVKKDRSTVRQYIDIFELPEEVIAAFRDPRAIAVNWNKELTSACRDRKEQTLARAARLIKANPAPTPDQVYKALTASSPAKDPKSKSMKLQETVKINDRPLFKIAMRGHKWTIDSTQIATDKRAILYERLKACAHEFILSELEEGK